MSARKDVEAYLDELEGEGWKVERTGGSHWKLTHPSGEFIICSSTPGARGLQNLEGDVNRLLRKIGVLTHKGEGERREKKVAQGISGISHRKEYDMNRDRDPWPNLPQEFDITFELRKEEPFIEVRLPPDFDKLGLWLEGELGKRRLVVNTTAGGNKGIINNRCVVHVGKPPLLDGIDTKLTFKTRRNRSWILIGDTIERIAVYAHPQPKFERPAAVATFGDILAPALQKKEEPKPVVHVVEGWKPRPEEEETNAQKEPKMAKTRNYKRGTLDNLHQWAKLTSKSLTQIAIDLGYSEGAISGWLEDGNVPLVADNCLASWIRTMELEKELADLKTPKTQEVATVEEHNPLDFIKQGLAYLNNFIKNNGLTAFIKNDGTIGAKVVTTVEL